MEIPLIEKIKIQAQVLVPLIRTLQAELGEEQANALVRQALGAHYRQAGQAWWRAQGTRSFEEKMDATFDRFAASGALDYQVLKRTADTFEVNVTGCRYAEFYKELGVPELGFLLSCSADLPMVEGFGGEVQFTRTQTIMQGGNHCDFRYRLNKETQAKSR
jgi:predicted ArsR family transcriptional regulator